MPVEIEKKYRLTKQQKQNVLRRLSGVGAKLKGTDFEENTLYDGEAINPKNTVLRLRRINKRAILTYKQRIRSSSSIKHQREEETHVADADALEAILEALGFAPFLVYEKRRMTWRLGKAEIVIDDLPFGLFMEIEAAEDDILEVERKLGLKGLKAEHATYPQLARKHGKKSKGVIEARFKYKTKNGSAH